MANCKTVLMGNHDFAVFYEPYNFNTGAESASYWTRRCFEQEPDPELRTKRWRFLGGFPPRVKTDQYVALHASPRRPINEYIFPDDIYTNPGKFVAMFERVDRLCFVGHTHVPGVFLEGPDFYTPDELDYRFEITDEKAIVNVGSVGQPRDRDPRTSYVVVDESSVEFVRLEYDVKQPSRSSKPSRNSTTFLAARLIDGESPG